MVSDTTLDIAGSFPQEEQHDCSIIELRLRYAMGKGYTHTPITNLTYIKRTGFKFIKVLNCIYHALTLTMRQA